MRATANVVVDSLRRGGRPEQRRAPLRRLTAGSAVVDRHPVRSGGADDHLADPDHGVERTDLDHPRRRRPPVHHRAGRPIRIWDGTQLLATPFLTVSPIASGRRAGPAQRRLPPAVRAERVLLRLLHDSAGNVVIARYQVSADSQPRQPGQRRVLLTIPHPAAATTTAVSCSSDRTDISTPASATAAAAATTRLGLQCAARQLAARQAAAARRQQERQRAALLRHPAEQPFCWPRRSARRDLGEGHAQPVALRVRPAHRQPVHRRCRSEHARRGRLPVPPTSRAARTTAGSAWKGSCATPAP